MGKSPSRASFGLGKGDPRCAGRSVRTERRLKGQHVLDVETGTGSGSSRPAVASTAVAEMLLGPAREAAVLGSTAAAAYLAFVAPRAEPEMLALLAPGAVRLPIGMCLPEGMLPDAGTPAVVGDGAVAVAGARWRPARWWDPRPRIDRSRVMRSGGRLLVALLQESPTSFGLSPGVGVEVARAMIGGDPGPALDQIGRGPGLTPAGDDVVAGVLAVLELTGRLDRGAARAVVDRASTHTSRLSGALLAAASRGQVIPQAARLLAVLAAAGGEDGLHATLAQLFAVGSTSGHDLALGMAGALAAARSNEIEEAA